MNDSTHVVINVTETGSVAVAGEEFFEPHDDAYGATLFVLGRNDALELAERVL